MAKRRRKRKNQAFALDPRITRCPEQAFNIEKHPVTGEYTLEYYVINDSTEIEKTKTFQHLITNKKMSICPQKDHRFKIGTVAKNIKTYQQNYRLKKNRGLKNKGSKTLKLMAQFNNNAELIFADVVLSSNVVINRLENEKVTESFFKALLPSHKDNAVLSVAQEFSSKINKRVKASEQVSQAITYAASLATAYVAKENNIPFMYRQRCCKDDNMNSVFYRLVTNPEEANTQELQATMDCPLREFRKAVNAIQIVRFASHKPLLDESIIEVAAAASNERQNRMLTGSRSTPLGLKLVQTQ